MNPFFHIIFAILTSLVIHLIYILYFVDDSFVNDRLRNNTDIHKLPPKIRTFKEQGKYHTVNGYKMFVYHEKYYVKDGTTTENHVAPVVLFHGFPSSCYEFNRVIKPLSQTLKTDVYCFDNVGFGFSDKPKNYLVKNDKTTVSNTFYSYSCIDHAEQALILLGSENHLNLKSAIFVSHDMGDTILAEVLGRIDRGTAPQKFLTNKKEKTSFVQGVIFTNGGMVYREANPRITQHLLSAPFGIGSAFNKLISYWGIQSKIMSKQLQTVWSSGAKQNPESAKRMLEDIEDIITMLNWEGGDTIMSDLIRYIPDRSIYEPRWHGAISRLHENIFHQHSTTQTKNIARCGFLWGDDDAVAPLNIAKALYFNVSKEKCRLIVMPKKGHFLQLESDPQVWVDHVKKIALGEDLI